MKKKRNLVVCAALLCGFLALLFHGIKTLLPSGPIRNSPLNFRATGRAIVSEKPLPADKRIPLKAAEMPKASVATAQILAIPATVTFGADGGISLQARKQIAALEAEKSRRTPAQLKMDSQLIYAGRMERGLAVAEGVAAQRVDLDRDEESRVLVDIRATVSPDLLEAIRVAGGNVASSFPEYRAIRATLPLSVVEGLAARPDVSFVEPAVRATLNAVDSQGDYAQLAKAARSTFGVTGTNVKVGVISDSVDYLTGSQINGLVTVLPGQSGIPASGEGTPMLEIVNDLAPGASLYFATGKGGTAAMASNIQLLFSAGCNIIVDDILYANEPPFQDGMVAQAVNQVTSAGGLFFSSAGDSGNQDRGFSGTWEGDFVDGGLALGFGEAGRLHSFAANTNYNTVSSGTGSLRLDFFWSDPLGASTNDYDIFVLNSTGTNVLASSTNPQNGTQDPYESLGTLTAGELIVILKKSGAGRFLHLESGRGRLSFNTGGNTRGHNSATNAYNIAAVYSGLAGFGSTNAFAGGGQDPVEQFSSDGPRRVFYQADGTAITTGNYSSTGGAVRQKPDLAAADGVSTDITQSFLFSTFYGTSAAAPHAAAIAALLWSYNPTLTTAQIRDLLTTNALDIMGAGVDRDSGYGIVMALPSLLAAPKPPLVLKASARSNQIFVTFNAPVGKPYTVQYSTNLAISPWLTLTNFTPSVENVGFTDSSVFSQRYYRVQTTTN